MLLLIRHGEGGPTTEPGIIGGDREIAAEKEGERASTLRLEQAQKKGTPSHCTTWVKLALTASAHAKRVPLVDCRYSTHYPVVPNGTAVVDQAFTVFDAWPKFKMADDDKAELTGMTSAPACCCEPLCVMPFLLSTAAVPNLLKCH